MDTWLAAGNFNNANLKGDLYTKVGIACACDQVAQVRCVFIFGRILIGNAVVNTIPQFMPYTSAASCPSVNPLTLFSASGCTATQFSDGKGCYECNS